MDRNNLFIIILLVLVSFSLKTNANENILEGEFTLRVKGIERTPYDYIFRLKQVSPYPKVNLDCQSFFNGLHFMSKDEIIIDKIVLDHQECEQLFRMIWKKEKEHLCLRVHLERGELFLDQSGTSCEK